MNGRGVIRARRYWCAVVLALCVLIGLLPSVATGGTHHDSVEQAEQRLREAHQRVTDLSHSLDIAAGMFERAQAHRLTLTAELETVEQGVATARKSERDARASLRRRVTAAYRAPYTDLALAAAILDAPDAATALHRARLMARLTVRGAHEVSDMRQAESRAEHGLRQRRIIAAGAAAAMESQAQQADLLKAALVAASQDVAAAERDLVRSRKRAQAAARIAARDLGALPQSLDGKTCPVAGPNGFIDSWGFPRSGGRSHQGVDMFAEYGTPLVAVADGVVRKVWVNRLGGLSVDLLSADGDRYYYAHLSAVSVDSGQRVQAGDMVGAVGNSGNAISTPPHLHWQFHPDGGAPVNPFTLARSLCR